MTLLLVALGAAVGASLRFLAGHHLDRGAHGIHRGTLLANVVGSFVLGLVVAHADSAHTVALLGTGFCGGLTTYSAFAVQTVSAPRPRALSYAVLTIGLCLAAAWIGLRI